MVDTSVRIGYTERVINRKKTFVYSLSSYSEFLEQVNRERVRDKDSCSSFKGDKKFTETRSFDEALELATFGWRQGREKMSEKVRELSLCPQLEVAPRYYLDVAGMYPEIPIAVSGDPSCMVNIGDTRVAQKRVFRIVCGMSATHYTSTEAIINRGVALLSYIDHLELQGYSVELTSLQCATEYRTRIISMYPVKGLGEHVDIDRIAFAFAHPSCLRRLHFSLYEQVQDEEFWSDMRYGYGRVEDPSKEELQALYENDIYVPAMFGNSGYSSLEEALTTVGKLMEEPFTKREEIAA